MNKTSVEVVAHEAPAKMNMLVSTLEVPVFKQYDSTGVILSDRCQARLNEIQLRDEFETKLHFFERKRPR